MRNSALADSAIIKDKFIGLFQAFMNKKMCAATLAACIVLCAYLMAVGGCYSKALLDFEGILEPTATTDVLTEDSEATEAEAAER